MALNNDQLKRRLAPGGELRAAINLGNPVLAQKSFSGELTGVSVALARALAEWIDVPLRLVPFDAAGKVVTALGEDAWDLAFLARDPKRAETICFTDPYVIIEGTYLVPRESSNVRVTDLDQEGVRISVGQGAAYDLFLTRTLQCASLVRAPTSTAAVDWFVDQGLEAAAGVRQPLERFAQEHSAYRVLPDAFTQIEQAMALPRDRQDVIAWVESFLQARKANGFVAEALKQSGQEEAKVAS
ncbi:MULTISPECIES: transporter substrate-binding domain-containing protein [unclassified Halomonas]|uniref:transporter substrate-binding domain-containing protein n=1 Tax=Halomonas sp. N3-2A TaxID=2014541 RepID=UPI000B5B44EF|nr:MULTISPECIES: transporter substrate-binding domain-containing protein [unclassified Halomonas]ASK21560.1 restriction endonuclease [Halomonas sp. N3-2A]UTD56461.1 transporter substrate-binding domain-containing protein [Halomonas sp. MS1]